ncbi:hypothetical protein [Echinicola vietnamensis]|uniref:Uncharacterized protein n=1 Tax=Echinicola vietnamensis (strain DSM 17526 / LMG 23754 / KMM 6221) TaxID=926556 RepID=L0G0N9_ECHVK|nr:hypothetical protein [Echinicola vietnamensis]AGA78873.1 hypothetical protein Echvi_2631 [Echinicola vietnamensis DSM 17526]
MKSDSTNTISVFAGLIIGWVIQMGLILITGMVVSLPSGMDLTSIAGFKSSLHGFTTGHLLIFLGAHATGTLAGAFTSALISLHQKQKSALTIGFCFLLGGLFQIFLLPFPAWYGILDMGLAYIPFAYFGYRLALKGTSNM